MNLKTEEKLLGLYGDDLPGYIRDATEEHVVIGVDSGEHEVTSGDVARYYRYDVRNISSGCRSLGGIFGDWRNIDALVKECLEIFKVLNIEKLRSECNKLGLVPKF